jgi:2-polyprenyl-6-hydroxyphenyl methylase/3-demethylubiquinone-9 3-methyltransferase
VTAAAPELFDRGGWWDPGCRAFRSLRAVNDFRVALLRDWLGRPTDGMVVVDLGCGGGLLAAPLANAGARVVGVDLARTALAECRAAGGERALAVAGDLLAPPLADGCADLVLLADVLEHVAEPAAAVRAAARLVRVGGQLFVNTIARTRRSRWLAITLAEGLGFVPRGTHTWASFVQPDELERYARAAALQLQRRCGESPRWWASLRSGAIQLRPSHDLSIGYAALYRRIA